MIIWIPGTVLGFNNHSWNIPNRRENCIVRLVSPGQLRAELLHTPYISLRYHKDKNLGFDHVAWRQTFSSQVTRGRGMTVVTMSVRTTGIWYTTIIVLSLEIDVVVKINKYWRSAAPDAKRRDRELSRKSTEFNTALDLCVFFTQWPGPALAVYEKLSSRITPVFPFPVATSVETLPLEPFLVVSL